MNKKIIILIGIITILVAFIFGCAAKPVVVDDSKATDSAVYSVVEANNKFAFELYSQLNKDGENVFFSPYSISTALAMTYEGARGKTAEEMQSVLHFPKDDVSRRSSFARIYNELNKKDKEYKLSTANALWGQKDFSFEKDFIDAVQNYYGGKLQNLDFKTDAENSRQTINKWVEGQTNDRIKDLIPQRILNPLTRLVLTNAIYFKGAWVMQFEKKDTKDEDFRTNGKTIKVPMMSLAGEKARFNYSENDEIQIIELPYKGGEISMIIILPKNDLNSLALNNQKLNEYKSLFREQRVNVFLPKFKFETKSMLKPILTDMGMPTAFSDYADFTGMTLEEPLWIDEVIHQAFVEVNEEGTEAAAATAVVMQTSAMPQPIPVFRADHPFIFIIQERATGNILFLGRVANPLEK